MAVPMPIMFVVVVVVVVVVVMMGSGLCMRNTRAKHYQSGNDRTHYSEFLSDVGWGRALHAIRAACEDVSSSSGALRTGVVPVTRFKEPEMAKMWLTSC
jgi:hypothetical protein